MKFNELLKRVEKPTRYLGEERGSVVKDPSNKVNFLLAFPDRYEVGMSHLGMHILYGLVNDQEEYLCERVFAPAPDMEAFIREGQAELFSLESKRPMKDFDIVGFTLQYEMSFLGVLRMLELGGLALRREERLETDPPIIAGGPAGFNPEPMSGFIDLFLLGDGEEALLEILELWEKTGNKEDFLREALKIRGVYVPKFYEPVYEGGVYMGLKKLVDEAPLPIKKALVNDLDSAYFPKTMIVPFMDIIHDRAVMEIFRGCTKGCRFCQAGMIYRPLRERSLKTIVRSIDSLLKEGGYNEVGLSSLSTLDYSAIYSLVDELTSSYSEDHIRFSLPSLRLDTFSIEVLELLKDQRKGSLTFAPEAGSQRMRDVINKNVGEEDLFNTMEKIFKDGYKKVKFYFMMGLPGETLDDVREIAELTKKVLDLYRKLTGRSDLHITVSTSCLVPKPFTPFQWMAQESIEDFEEKQQLLRSLLKGKNFRYDYHDASTSVAEGHLCRSGREMVDLLEYIYINSDKTKAVDYFDGGLWQQAFEHFSRDLNEMAGIETDQVLFWDHIDVGVKKTYLMKEWHKAQQGLLTEDCRWGCLGCGVNLAQFGGVCNDY